MKFRPGEEFQDYWARVNQCDFDLNEPDELRDFFDTVPGRIRDALTPYATQWENPPAFNHRFWKGYVAQRTWLDKAILILTEIAHKHAIDVAPFRYFTRLIHGETPRDSDECRAVVDAVRDLHLAIFGTDGEYVLIWDREEDNVAAESTANESQATTPSVGSTPPKQYLMNWAEILTALDLKNNIESRNRVRRLNNKFDGPIIISGRGAQPTAEQAKLSGWWDSLEGRFNELQSRQLDKAATVASHHDFGRDGTVIPEIGGGVRGRRTSKNVGKGRKRS